MTVIRELTGWNYGPPASLSGCVTEEPMNPDWRNRYELAVAAAQKAGDHARTYFDQNVRVEWKNDQSPVTLADREAEEIIRKELLGTFSGDGFLGEESGDTPGASGFRWIIDPVDATRNFVRNIPIWATLIGLEYRGEMIAGVVYLPALGEITYRALRGDGCWRGDRRIHVSTVARLDESVLFYSSRSWFLKAGRDRDFHELARQTQRQRGFGDFYGFVLVAQGSGELMVDHGLQPWDIAALSVIVEEAGGKFTNWSGERNVLTPDVVASNSLVHDAALNILGGSAG